MKRTLHHILHFIRHNISSIFFGILFLMAIVAYSYGKINFTGLAGAIVSIATIYYGNLKSRIENDILFKELFKSFNERYDKKFNDLINTLKFDESKNLEPDDIILIIDYFNLCAEEFLWKTKDRIPKDVWKAWKAGIQENLKIRQVRELFEKETLTFSGQISYYGLYNELKK